MTYKIFKQNGITYLDISALNKAERELIMRLQCNDQMVVDGRAFLKVCVADTLWNVVTVEDAERLNMV